jgi:hypothetical protein
LKQETVIRMVDSFTVSAHRLHPAEGFINPRPRLFDAKNEHHDPFSVPGKLGRFAFLSIAAMGM